MYIRIYKILLSILRQQNVREKRGSACSIGMDRVHFAGSVARSWWTRYKKRHPCLVFLTRVPPSHLMINRLRIFEGSCASPRSTTRARQGLLSPATLLLFFSFLPSPLSSFPFCFFLLNATNPSPTPVVPPRSSTAEDFQFGPCFTRPVFLNRSKNE